MTGGPAIASARPWFAGRNTLVVGVGRSGMAAARLLARHGARVRAADRRKAEDLASSAEELHGLGVELRCGETGSDLLEGCDLVVASPGVPLDLPIFEEAARRGIEIVPELDLGCAVARAPVIAVTGTNGKSTTVELLGAMGREAERSTEVLGNIGTALSERAETVPPDGLLVVEVSSFQLETSTRFRPSVGVILNITPDHLDRHGTMDRYAAIKARLFERQGPDDYRVQPLGDARIARLLQPMQSRPLWFGLTDPVGEGVWEEGGRIRFRAGSRDGVLLARSDAPLRGPHNTENICAAAAAALAVGLPPRALSRALEGFRGLPHRLALVATIDGVRYVNDSKATNVDAMKRALESFDDPITLIAGGRDKDGDFASVEPLVTAKVRRAVYVGEAAPKLERAWPRVPSSRAATLEEAVEVARAASTPGSVVLLAPGCASYDMFRNFEERGARFEGAVLALERVSARGRTPS